MIKLDLNALRLLKIRVIGNLPNIQLTRAWPAEMRLQCSSNSALDGDFAAFIRIETRGPAPRVEVVRLILFLEQSPL